MRAGSAPRSSGEWRRSNAASAPAPSLRRGRVAPPARPVDRRSAPSSCDQMPVSSTVDVGVDEGDELGVAPAPARRCARRRDPRSRRQPDDLDGRCVVVDAQRSTAGVVDDDRAARRVGRNCGSSSRAGTTTVSDAPRASARRVRAGERVQRAGSISRSVSRSWPAGGVGRRARSRPPRGRRLAEREQPQRRAGDDACGPRRGRRYDESSANRLRGHVDRRLRPATRRRRPPGRWSGGSAASGRAPAVAPCGSPSTPLGLTARTPLARSSSIRSVTCSVRPRSARSRRTSSGAMASISDVSVCPACASDPVTCGHQASTRRCSDVQRRHRPPHRRRRCRRGRSPAPHPSSSRPSGPARRSSTRPPRCRTTSVPGKPACSPLAETVIGGATTTSPGSNDCDQRRRPARPRCVCRCRAAGAGRAARTTRPARPASAAGPHHGRQANRARPAERSRCGVRLLWRGRAPAHRSSTGTRSAQSMIVGLGVLQLEADQAVARGPQRRRDDHRVVGRRCAPMCIARATRSASCCSVAPACSSAAGDGT